MELEDNKLLHKIIDLQSCIIQGRDIKAMLHKDKKFYQERTQADIIAVYVNEHEKMNIEYIVEDHHLFKHLVEKYIFSNHSFSWDDFIQNCEEHFTLDNRYHHTRDLYDIFKGIISKNKALEFSEELQFKEAVMMPIYAFDNKETIAHICFMYQKDARMIEIKNLEEIKILFQTLLRPLHDNDYSIIYSKCIRVDEHLKLLTEQEKRITKKVLEGKSYPEVAEILNISINTIKTHMKNIFNKYQVSSKIELFTKLNTYH